MNRRGFFRSAATATAVGLAGLSGCRRKSTTAAPVLYCAQDREYAEVILKGFADAHGTAPVAKFDTEATKSVSLFEEIVREVDRPRCTVFWNNEILNTIRLHRRGLLEPYFAPNSDAYPSGSRPADGAWQAFAARVRVLIVNTNLVPRGEEPTSLFDLAENRWAEKVCMAKPQFGTNATQAACLFSLLGREVAEGFYNSLSNNRIAVVSGNKQAAVRTAAGDYAIGLTDSDDAMIEVLAGRPVRIVLPDAAGSKHYPAMGLLHIPNTIGLIRGGPAPEEGRALINYLLRAETERELAAGGGYQIPLRADASDAIHPQLAAVRSAVAMKVDWESAADHWDIAQRFLRDRFAR